MIVAILGAGNGGASAVVDLGQRGFETRLWNRSNETLAPFRQARGIKHTGIFGEGIAQPALMTNDLAEAIKGSDIILVCLPTLAHAEIAESLAKLNFNTIPVVLNPGHTGGALEFVATFNRHKVPSPPVAELSTLTYVARKSKLDTVWTTGAAKHVWVAALPGGESALAAARQLYPNAELAKDVIASGLANVNMVLHPPGAILGASWVESRGGNFTFYAEGLPDGVGRIMAALDDERLAVANAFGHEMPDLFAEMQSIGTIEGNADITEGLAVAIRAGDANSKIMAPDSLMHRYYQEDFWYGIKPFLAFSEIAQVHVPVARSLMHLAELLIGDFVKTDGRSTVAMGIEDLNKDELVELVTQPQLGNRDEIGEKNERE